MEVGGSPPVASGDLLGAVLAIGAGRSPGEVLDRLVRAALLLVPPVAGAVAAAGAPGPDGELLDCAAVTLDLALPDPSAALARLRTRVAGGDAVQEPVPVAGASPGVLLVAPCPESARPGLRALATAAGVALANARLIEQGALRRRWLEASAEILASMLGDADRDEELGLVARRAREVALARLALILLPSGRDEVVVEVVDHDAYGDAGTLVGTRVPRVGTLSGSVLEEGEALVVDGVPEGVRDVRGDLPAPDGWPGGGPTMLVPLGPATDVRGVLALVRAPGAPPFTELDLTLAGAFAAQAALALQRARAQSDRAALAVLEDRDRIARDLHDLVIQRLFATGLQLQGVARRAEGPLRERVEGAVDDLDQTIRDIRTTIFKLHRRPDSTDLRGQLHDVADEAARPLGFPVLLELRGPISEAVPDELAPHLVAVLRESLSNVAKHAQAGAVTVTVTADRDLTLTVEDDGRGFVADRAGSGMRNMRRRAEMHGGRLEVTPRPGGGTRLTWHVPT